MKPLRLITSLAAAACTLAVSSARAQSSITNQVTLNILTYTQTGETNNGTTTIYTATKAPHSAPQLLQGELGPLLGLSSAAKLVLITGNSGADFAIIDGANFYDLTTNGVMSLTPGDTRIRAGVQSDASPERKTVDTQLITVTYDDTGLTNGTNHGSLTFTLQGLATIAQSDTAPVNNTYTESVKAKATLAGEGNGGNPFVATCIMNVSGKGPLTVVVP